MIIFTVFFLTFRQLPGSTLTDTPVPYTTLFRSERRILLGRMDAEFVEQRGVRVGEADEQIAAGIAMTIDLHRRDVGDVPFLEMDVFAADQIGRASCRERVCQYV